ncbi:terminase small subunit [Achromobacter xylosoxidans]|uniref:terminase small subunit n=1 Tax=Alcaligenes xylosoxydans xylosoxydans TaxID=85698 RepID=UPI0012A8483A|nr:terminase small subunit [Achromobacter xylosoxidans]CUR73969.1 Terminase small subunit [Achromobacter xylosoxidans]
MSLTDKQKRFVEAYLLDPNGKKAAIAAGYSAKTAEVAASRLLRHVEVAAEINRRREVIQIKAGVTPEMVVSELAKLGFSDIRQVIAWRTVDQQAAFDAEGEPVELPDVEITIKNSEEIAAEAAAAIAEVSRGKDGTLKVKMHDKLGALVRIGQHLGMFRAPVGPDAPGKKEQAEIDAKTAQKGSDWDALLPGGARLQ